MKKVVFLTDVRYWRCRTGAQQRINALVQYMVRCGNEVTTLFAAPLLEEGGSKNAEKVCDHSLITNANLKVISLVDDWNPFGLAKKIKWQGKCILNALTSGLRKNDGGAENPNATNQATLASLQTVEFVERVDEFLCRIDPDVVVVEYVTLAYLLPPLDSRRFLSVLDTHDLLASRCRQFEKLGHSHWLQITSEEEFAVFQSFDCVLAIQEHEAQTIRDHTRGPDVVVCGHPVLSNDGSNDVSRNPVDSKQQNEISVGYFASDNAANRDALQWLLTSIWPQVCEHESTIRLVLAGSVCNGLDLESLTKETLTNVQVLGSIDHVEEFYSEVDLVLNPIRFGTGLKIKNIEAIQFARPLISTAHGVEAMPVIAAELAPWAVANTTDEFAATIVETARSSELRSKMGENANVFAKLLTPEAVYGDLLRFIKERAK